MVCPVRGTGGTQEKFEEDTRREAERAEDRAASLAPVRTFATGKHRNDWLESWRSNSPCFTSPAFSGKRAKRKQARRSVYSIESVATACRDSLRSTRHESSCEACRNEARGEVRLSHPCLAGPLNTDLPVVLADDLNSDAYAPSFASGPAYGMLVSAGFLDVWNLLDPNDPGLTWPLFGEDPPLGPSSLAERIDLVLVRGSGIQAMAILLTGTTAPFASDHVGLVADFNLFP